MVTIECLAAGVISTLSLAKRSWLFSNQRLNTSDSYVGTKVTCKFLSSHVSFPSSSAFKIGSPKSTALST
ncbi:hypothetical protein BpHYR1_054490 [Brachionus plicatilis]|uniref:Uncharacterized protein n=1 Tax=Brachionus plicatilis TaxID=10195 RepID=A0A3M7S7L0_BRAPC|nr:hypothetical protein BpHYR1_054490 [Brachionus plicatilis]